MTLAPNTPRRMRSASLDLAGPDDDFPTLDRLAPGPAGAGGGLQSHRWKRRRRRRPIAQHAHHRPGAHAISDTTGAEPRPPSPSPALPRVQWSADVEASPSSGPTTACTSTTARGATSGENIAASSPGVWPTIEGVVQAWASEAPDYDYASNSCAPGLVMRPLHAAGVAREHAHRLCLCAVHRKLSVPRLSRLGLLGLRLQPARELGGPASVLSRGVSRSPGFFDGAARPPCYRRRPVRHRRRGMRRRYGYWIAALLGCATGQEQPKPSPTAASAQAEPRTRGSALGRRPGRGRAAPRRPRLAPSDA